MDPHSDLRLAVAKLCARYPGTYWQKLDRVSAYPTQFVQELTEAGFLAALIPEEYGGSGLSLRAACVILEEINASGCTASQSHAQMYIMGTLLRHGTPAQKALYLPDIAAGRSRLQAFGVTEPTTGSDTTQLQTTATRQGDIYVLNGQKIWTSRAEHSDLMLVLARTTSALQVRRRTDGLSVFLLNIAEALKNGLTIRPIDAMINHNTTEVFFDNVPVPASNLIGAEGAGFACILDGLNAERIMIASEAIGDGKWFIKKAKDYAKERHVFGRPIGQNQGIQFPLARAYANLEAADLMAQKAASLFEAGDDCASEANMAKLLSSEAAWQAAEAAMQTFGGFGFARAYDVERKWREVRLFQTAPISTNMVLAYLGHKVLGLPKSY
jgi:acyl-CoA dehydrogenase